MLFGSAAVSVLCAAVSNATAFRDKMISGKISKLFHLVYLLCGGVGFGIGGIRLFRIWLPLATVLLET